MHVAGGNTFHQHQDTNNLVKACSGRTPSWSTSLYWTATVTCRYRPAAITSYERKRSEMGGDYSQLYVFPMHQCVPLQHESRSDFDIFSAMAAKLGVQEAFTEGKDETQWLESGMYDDMKTRRAPRGAAAVRHVLAIHQLRALCRRPRGCACRLPRQLRC